MTRLKQEQLRLAKKRDKKHHQPDLSTSSRKSDPADSRKHLQGMRVTQKNLVYVIGLSIKLVTDEALTLLKGPDYFGQYGKIQKIMVNKRKDIPPLRGGTFDKSGSSVSVYVTFARDDDAAKCIRALDGAVVDGNTLRAAYGTTKYCTAFLQYRQCPNPNCMYLHSEQDKNETDTKDAAAQHVTKAGSHPKPTVAPATAKPLSAEEKPERPILPTSVSWAKAAVGARAHSPPQERVQQVQGERRQSIPSSIPPQPSPTSTPEPPSVAISTAVADKSNMDLIPPSDISVAASDQRPRIATRVFDRVLENFQKGSFKFGLAADIIASDDFKFALQASPYFQFKRDVETSETASDIESKDSEQKQSETPYAAGTRGFDPFASKMENGTHKRQQPRFAYVSDPISRALAQPVPSATPSTQVVRPFSPPRMTDPALAQQIQTAHVTSQFKNATPPPPGMYMSHVQQYDIQQRRQQLLEQQRMQYNPEYGYYPQQVPARSFATTGYDDADNASVYASQARRHLLDTQGRSTRQQTLTKTDSLQDLSGSFSNMRMSPHLPQGFGGAQPPLPQSYAAQQGAFMGRRFMNAF